MTSGAFVIVNLMGGVALLLWGVRMVRTGILRAWGDGLNHFIAHNLATRLSAMAAGLGTTLLVQSGTATALILTGLAANASIEAARGLAVLLGADIGSALIAALFATTGTSLSGWISPILMFAGYTMFSLATEFRPRNAGRILMGLGLVFLALKIVVAASAPLRDATLFHAVLTSIAAEPLLAFLMGAAVTWLSYSSLAVILLVASFLASGSLDTAGAVAIVLGVNLGAGLPALSASANQPPQVRRLPMGNFLARGVLAVLLLAFTPHIALLLDDGVSDPVQRMALLHVGFNVAVAFVFMPMAAPMMVAMKRLLPDVKQAEDSLKMPRYLDRVALSTPAVALSNAAHETVRMAELLERMLKLAADALKTGSLETLKAVKQTDGLINSYHREIHGYLEDLSQKDIDSVEGRQALEIMLYVSNLEHAGDLVELNWSDRIKAKVKESIAFTPKEQQSINALVAILLASLRIACGVVASGDLAGARRLIVQKDKFRIIENKIIDAHFREPREKGGKALRRRALFIDMVRDLHTIHSHITAAAYPIVDAAGLLRESRLRETKKKS
ncbi:MAG: Na/Pi cotransporter family protein [Aestuariivirgaceae bacterium]|nr:Na/Pi cotransporter family protein [Aestuariivirgaceae bacterium]